jgi:N-acetylneuraminic acid mutarotase
MLAFGGVISSGNDAQNDLHAFDPSADRWRKIELADPKPPVRYHGMLGYHAGKLWIAKGGDLSAAGDYAVDLKTGVRSDWGGDNKPAFAHQAAMSVVSDKFFRFGGTGYLTKGYWFDPKSGAWTAQPGDGPVNRMSHCMVASDKEVLVFGSSDSGEAMNLKTGTWRTLPAPTPSLAGGFSPCGWDGKYMYRYNGSAAGRLDVDAGVWEAIDLTGGPANRSNSTGTWVGEAFAIVGGSGTTFETHLYYP